MPLTTQVRCASFFSPEWTLFVSTSISGGSKSKDDIYQVKRQRFDLNKFFAALAILHQDDMKKRMNCIRMI